MKAYSDLHNLNEDDRINTIGQFVMNGNKTAFVVEDESKANRYINKIKRRFPKITQFEILHDCPFAPMISVKVFPPAKNPDLN